MKLSDIREKIGQPDAIPEGWKTAEQWAAEEKDMSVRSAGDLIKAAVKKGLMEKKSFRVMRDVVRPIPHYRIVAAPSVSKGSRPSALGNQREKSKGERRRGRI